MALRPGEHERGVATVVGVDHPGALGTGVHLPRPVADGVEEPAVVGDHHQRGRTTDQVLGEPRDRLDVEVVGRLVEDQQVDVVEQQAGQRAAAAFSTREPVHGPVEGHVGQQHLDDLAGGRVTRPLVVVLAGEHDLAHGVGVVEQVALVEVADVQPAVQRDPATVGGLPAGHQVEQGGLAVAVAPDDADALTLGDAEAHLVEQDPHAVGLGDLLEVQQV